MELATASDALNGREALSTKGAEPVGGITSYTADQTNDTGDYWLALDKLKENVFQNAVYLKTIIKPEKDGITGNAIDHTLSIALN